MDTQTTWRFMLLILNLCLFLKISVSLVPDNIYANESLSGDKTIVSAGGDFVLGFFNPGNSSNYYISMWYKQVPAKTVVWVANRDKPVLDRFSSELKIFNGNLILYNESKFPIWSTNVKASANSALIQAVLLNNGNLVLNNGSNSSKPLWQSFDSPTDTWLPGNRMGYSKITKTKKVLTSWKSSEDPAPGIFSFQLDPSDISYNTLWNSSRNYWTTGAWNGEIFSLVPENRSNLISYYKFLSNDYETSFIMYVFNSSTISRIVLDLSGQIKQEVWLPAYGWNVVWSFPRLQCEVYAFCGAYGSCSEKSLPFCSCLTGFEPNSKSDWDLNDYSGGCNRKKKLHCENNNLPNGERDRFLQVNNMSFPEYKQSAPAGNITECETTCFSNCSCIAYAYENNGCSIWTGDLLNMKQVSLGGRTLYIRLAAAEFPSSKYNKGTFIGVVVGLAAGLVVFLGLIVFLTLRRRNNAVGTGKLVGCSLMAFRYRDLQQATKNFSKTLGGGGFGSVFKGTLPDSTEIAVKKLESIFQGEKQFRTEVSTIGAIQHVNLVRLRGFCSQGSKKLLVYDYMSNGSLASHLFHGNDSNVLDWKTRYEIALGTARGLLYLHEECRDCIIHCDIKPENILLDSEFNPKVADFGLAKPFGREFSRVLTTIRGTRGYLAPEWISGVAITSKVDVYSYGMMLFEIVSGMRNSETAESGGKLNYFPCLAASLVMEGGNVLSLLDARLEGNAEVEELERVCKVACWCIQDDEAHRPSMGQVVQILEGIIDAKRPPFPRSLQVFDAKQDNVLFFTESLSS